MARRKTNSVVWILGAASELAVAAWFVWHIASTLD